MTNAAIVSMPLPELLRENRSMSVIIPPIHNTPSWLVSDEIKAIMLASCASCKCLLHPKTVWQIKEANREQYPCSTYKRQGGIRMYKVLSLFSLTTSLCITATLFTGCSQQADPKILEANKYAESGGTYQHLTVSDVTDGELTLHTQNDLQNRVQSILGRDVNVLVAGPSAFVVIGQGRTGASSYGIPTNIAPIQYGNAAHAVPNYGTPETFHGRATPFTGIHAENGENRHGEGARIGTKMQTVGTGTGTHDLPNGNNGCEARAKARVNRLGLIGTQEVSNDVSAETKAQIESAIKKANAGIQNIYYVTK